MINKPTKKLGIVLGGGGVRGFAHFGFLQVLEEAGINPHCISGISIGAFAGACFCMGIPMRECKKEIIKLSSSREVDFTTAPISTNALIKCRKFRRTMSSMLGDTKFNQLKVPFTCSAVDIMSGDLVNFRSGRVADAVLASSNFPVILKPYQLGNSFYVDGTARMRLPIKQCRQMGCDVILCVDVVGKQLEPYKFENNVYDIVFRLLNIADMNAHKMNVHIYDKYVDMMLVPDMNDVFQYKFKDLEVPYDEGYAMGINVLDRISDMIL